MVKLCSRYSCCKIKGKPWVVKELGDTGYIRNRTGKFICSRRESLLLPDAEVAAAKYEEEWADD